MWPNPWHKNVAKTCYCAADIRECAACKMLRAQSKRKILRRAERIQQRIKTSLLPSEESSLLKKAMCKAQTAKCRRFCKSQPKGRGAGKTCRVGRRGTRGTKQGNTSTCKPSRRARRTNNKGPVREGGALGTNMHKGQTLTPEAKNGSNRHRIRFSIVLDYC